MTFTEAAVEVLRRAGVPMHYKDIAQAALNEGLLSHVGVMPETTMGARLLAMASRDAERPVMLTDTGVFALSEWGLEPAAEALLEAPKTELEPEEAYRPRERHPPLQEELIVGGRREERRRRGDGDEEGKKRKRFGPPAELAHAWLREHGAPATLAEIASALRATERIAEALERDLGSFEKALREENRRRKDGARPLLFSFLDDGRVEGLELPKEQKPQKKDVARDREKKREEAPARPVALDEQRKSVMRSLRRRLASLDVAALERVAVALLEAQGFRELNMARRSAKEGPLYLCRHRWGAGELRYAVRVLRPGRDIGRAEVQEVRRDTSHFSAQIGIVIGSAECTREARSEANAPSTTPVMLYGNEALAEALIEAGLGISRHLVEWIDYDEEFFASIGAEAPLEEVAELQPEQSESSEVPAPAAVVEPAPQGAPGEGRGRRRRRRGERRSEGVTVSEESSGSGASEPEVAPEPDVETAPVVIESTGAEPEVEVESAPAPVDIEPESETPSAEPEAPAEEPAPLDSEPGEPAPAESEEGVGTASPSEVESQEKTGAESADAGDEVK